MPRGRHGLPRAALSTFAKHDRVACKTPLVGHLNTVDDPRKTPLYAFSSAHSPRKLDNTRSHAALSTYGLSTLHNIKSA